MHPLQFIDTHCHIEQSEFDQDRDMVINQAGDAGIVIISSSITYDTWDKNLSIARTYPNVYAATGLEPVKNEAITEAIDWIQRYQSEIIAIGETGLDHYLERNHSAREIQELTFSRLIQLAKGIGLPIQVHSRSAGKAALQVLEKNEAEMVHMHAFDGKASLARFASNDLDYYFSIPTSVVRSPQKQKLVKAINIEKLLIETDSPVLAPERGMRNTPLNLPIVVKEIARILRRDEDELQKIILENTLRLYSRIRF